MGVVAIELQKNLTEKNIQDAFQDVIEAISEGYEAGTIALYAYTLYPGFWSLYPKAVSDTFPLLINIEHADGLNQYEIAGVVKRFADNYKR